MIDLQGHLRCDGCGKLLALRLEGVLEIVCPRCKRYQKAGHWSPEVLLTTNDYSDIVKVTTK